MTMLELCCIRNRQTRTDQKKPAIECSLLPVQEDKDNFCNAVRAEVKVAGLMDTTENCWSFFINKACAKSLRYSWRFAL